MKFYIPAFLFLICFTLISFTTEEKIKLALNGQEVKEKISLKSSGKLDIVLPEGWRYISGKIKILQGDEVKKAQQVVGESGLKEFDLLKFIKLNAVSGNYVSLELSVRTKESSTFTTMKFPIE